MKIYKVYWYPKVSFDCEKSSSYIFANSARESINHPAFKDVDPVASYLVEGEEEEEARKWGWCINEEK